jgi:hypothetical protein
MCLFNQKTVDVIMVIAFFSHFCKSPSKMGCENAAAYFLFLAHINKPTSTTTTTTTTT